MFPNARNLVIGISITSKINLNEFDHYILKNNWHLITDGGVFRSSIDNNIENANDLFKLYGISVTGESKSEFLLSKENICSDL